MVFDTFLRARSRKGMLKHTQSNDKSNQNWIFKQNVFRIAYDAPTFAQAFSKCLRLGLDGSSWISTRAVFNMKDRLSDKIPVEEPPSCADVRRRMAETACAFVAAGSAVGFGLSRRYADVWGRPGG